jgi:hypothetical protein
MRSFLLGVAISLSMMNIGSPAEWRSVTIFIFLSLLFLLDIITPEKKEEKEKQIEKRG